MTFWSVCGRVLAICSLWSWCGKRKVQVKIVKMKPENLALSSSLSSFLSPTHKHTFNTKWLMKLFDFSHEKISSKRRIEMRSHLFNRSFSHFLLFCALKIGFGFQRCFKTALSSAFEWFAFEFDELLFNLLCHVT